MWPLSYCTPDLPLIACPLPGRLPLLALLVDALALRVAAPLSASAAACASSSSLLSPLEVSAGPATT